jgi:hypothetical protein
MTTDAIGERGHGDELYGRVAANSRRTGLDHEFLAEVGVPAANVRGATTPNLDRASRSRYAEDVEVIVHRPRARRPEDRVGLEAASGASARRG